MPLITLGVMKAMTSLTLNAHVFIPWI